MSTTVTWGPGHTRTSSYRVTSGSNTTRIPKSSYYKVPRSSSTATVVEPPMHPNDIKPNGVNPIA